MITLDSFTGSFGEYVAVDHVSSTARPRPAWGLHNRTVIVLMAALAQNAWARHTWQRAIDRQQSPPQVAA